MKFVFPQNRIKQMLIFGIVAFLFVSLFGLSSFGMANTHGQMSDCPFMGKIALCQMTPLQHIATWQSMFTTIPVERTIALLVILFFSILTVFIFWNTERKLTSLAFVRKRFYLPDLIPPTLQEAFSGGILNPKIY